MPVMELTLISTVANQEIVNRFNYIAAGTPAAVSFSFALWIAFGAQYDAGAVPPAYPPNAPLRTIAGIQSGLVTYDSVSVRNVYSNTDFWESPFIQPLTGGAGTATETLAPFVAFGFRSSRVRADIRRGTKRFVGVLEGQVGSNGNFLSTTLAAMVTVGSKMAEVLNYNDSGNILTFTPCVVSKQQYIPDPDKPEKVAYRYYPTEVEQLAHVASGIAWDPYSNVRSQTSRQVGRGR